MPVVSDVRCGRAIIYVWVPVPPHLVGHLLGDEHNEGKLWAAMEKIPGSDGGSIYRDRGHLGMRFDSSKVTEGRVNAELAPILRRLASGERFAVDIHSEWNIVIIFARPVSAMHRETTLKQLGRLSPRLAWDESYTKLSGWIRRYPSPEVLNAFRAAATF